MKPERSSMKLLWIVILLVTLSACGQQAVALPTETPIPRVVSPTSVPTSTFIPVTITPSPLPTQPIISMITPDSIQVERWKEYQTALAKNIHADLPPEEVLCEWDILGRSGNDVYVWAVCKGKLSSASLPMVIHLESDGSVLSVEIPANWSRDIPRLFPTDVIEKFAHYQAGRAGELIEHIDWRRSHPEEPPLIVLSATPIP